MTNQQKTQLLSGLKGCRSYNTTRRLLGPDFLSEAPEYRQMLHSYRTPSSQRTVVQRHEQIYTRHGRLPSDLQIITRRQYVYHEDIGEFRWDCQPVETNVRNILSIRIKKHLLFSQTTGVFVVFGKLYISFYGPRNNNNR